MAMAGPDKPAAVGPTIFGGVLDHRDCDEASLFPWAGFMLSPVALSIYEAVREPELFEDPLL
jgi:hypothetical protein